MSNLAGNGNEGCGNARPPFAAALERVLERTHAERETLRREHKAMLVNLTATQERCSRLMTDNQRLRGSLRRCRDYAADARAALGALVEPRPFGRNDPRIEAALAQILAITGLTESEVGR
jgi:hypothetical protein